MKRNPTESEMDEITQAIRKGDRVGAISLYISATEAGLTEAQNKIRELTTQAGGARQEPAGKKAKAG